MTRKSIPKPPRYFVHPRYWSTWLGLGLFQVMTLLPFPLRLKLGAALGHLGYRLAGGRRHIVDVNLSLCFPKLTPAERASLTREVFRSTGMSLVETATGWLRDPAGFTDRFDIEGREILEEAVKSGRGAILLGMHFCTLDLAGAVVGTFARIDVMYRRNKNLLFDHVMKTGREKHFDMAIERTDMRQVIRRLREGHVVWYGGDQDYGPRHSVFAEFFGIPVATITATSRIARMTGAEVILFQHFRVSEDGRYRMIFRRPSETFPTGDDLVDARQVNRWAEEAIEIAPEQYWWLHRRFKTRPPGEARPY